MIRNLELNVLSAISQVIDKALDLEAALEAVLTIVSETLAMKRATITLMDAMSGQLAIVASHGLTTEEKKRGVYKLEEGVTGRIFRTKRPFVVPDIRQEPLFLDKTGARSIEKARVSFIGVPILLHGEAIGVLNVDRLFENEVGFQEDIDFLTVLATLIAQFISLNEQVRAQVDDLRRENASLKYRLSKETRGLYIVGKSQAMLDVQRQMERVSPTKATVLLLGESGSGKTLIARIIHDLSDRRDYPFIKVNCASIPENLLESELFGYERGAFTGAVASKAGRFEDARNGSIFLDEIGDLPMGLQAKLLRVLQDKEFERLGSNKTHKVDVRILTATNLDLETQVETGKFRPDLFYRLNVFPMHVPPLRERREDITSLLTHFLTKVSREYNRHLRFSNQALELLRKYDWPGNVREMENLVERLVILAEGGRIEADLIRLCLSVNNTESPEVQDVPEPVGRPSLKELERNEVLTALRRNDWVQHKAGKELGLTPRQIGYRIKKFGLEGLVAEQRAKVRVGSSSTH